jgi:hypothetical protein
MGDAGAGGQRGAHTQSDRQRTDAADVSGGTSG